MSDKNNRCIPLVDRYCNIDYTINDSLNKVILKKGDKPCMEAAEAGNIILSVHEKDQKKKHKKLSSQEPRPQMRGLFLF